MKKKITYLLFILPFMAFAQGPWDFNGTTDGFAGLNGNTVSSTGTDLSCVFTQAVINPYITNTAANINADDANSNFLEIRLKNNSLASHIKLTAVGATTVNKGFAIDPGDIANPSNNAYKTYYFDITTWTGTLTTLTLNFKIVTTPVNQNGTTYTPTAGENVLIDYIKLVGSVTTPEKNSFDFNTSGNAEGFTVFARSTAIQVTESTNGVLQIKLNAPVTPNAINSKVGLNSTTSHVNGTNKYAHVTLKNTSTNTEFLINGLSGSLLTSFSPAQTITTGDTNYKTYDFDLSAWDSADQLPELSIGVKETWSSAATYAVGAVVITSNSYYKNITGVNDPLIKPNLDTTNWVLSDATGAESPAAGAIAGGALDYSTNYLYVDQIVFDNTHLSTNTFDRANSTISLYPNPAKDVINISSSSAIQKIEVYDMLGKQVLSKNNVSQVGVESLGSGAYFIKADLENGSSVVKKFIKE
jgi:hypothetical protein